MNGFLLDTNVVSELRKRERCAPKVNAWAQSTEPNQNFLSVLVIGELRRGAILRRRSDRAAAALLEQWIARLTHLYGDRILPITLEIAQEWGRLSALQTNTAGRWFTRSDSQRSSADLRHAEH